MREEVFTNSQTLINDTLHRLELSWFKLGTHYMLFNDLAKALIIYILDQLVAGIFLFLEETDLSTQVTVTGGPLVYAR